MTGELPQWYRTLTAAKALGVAPWELAAQPLVWQEWAMTAEEAEHNYREEKQRHSSRKTASKSKRK
jgi:hypothetical protein